MAGEATSEASGADCAAGSGSGPVVAASSVAAAGTAPDAEGLAAAAGAAGHTSTGGGAASGVATSGGATGGDATGVGGDGTTAGAPDAASGALPPNLSAGSTGIGEAPIFEEATSAEANRDVSGAAGRGWQASGATGSCCGALFSERLAAGVSASS
jgi:hypothetical protein